MIVVRQTLREEARFEGRGLHSGVPVEVRIEPGEAGILFVCGAERQLADPDAVTDTTRCTRLGGISTVEHLMAAFAGLEITDAVVHLSAPELPALDGSALPFWSGLREAGLHPLPERSWPELFKRIFLQEDDLGIALSKGSGRWAYTYESPGRFPERQAFEAELPADFEAQIAPARTFAFAEEVQAALAAGLGQGLDHDSVLLLGESGYDHPPRFPDEPARHKLLDLMGDLYLSGVPVRALNVVARRSGHRANVEAARRLKRFLDAAR